MKTSPQQIEAFTYAARERSFSRAARALGVTQSAVTQHVANLEKVMGVQLFVRRRSGLELTKPARDLFLLSDRMCTIEQLIAERLAAYATLETGHLRVIANAPRPVLPLIAEFGRLYPDVRLTLTLCSWTVAMERVKQRDVDIAVITEPEPLDGIYALELERSRYMVYARREHPFAGLKSVALRDLADEPVIVPEAGSLTQKVLAERLEKNGMKLRRMIEMTTFPVVKEAVLSGIGVGILLDRSFHPSGQIVMRPIREIPEEFRTFLVTPSDRNDLRIVRSFIAIAERRSPPPNGG